jgi:hypothetical protein
MDAAQAKTDGSGWGIFAGIMIGLVGVFNFIDGIVAIANPHYFVFYPATNHLVFGDLTAWGWTILVIGVIQVLAALAILFTGAHWAAVVGVIIAVFNAIGQLLNLGVNPWWSVIAIAIDILVIYALAVHVLGRRYLDPVGPIT